ncbi:DUF1028 domain-containing protein [Falsiroseomonas stagni]|uniref:Uncharacterized conserved protein, Ntn-hydrolase superfamily n=1 Tax=Falsiroseomonas stagni DSM 19981 TaxID=1123062 RepID=A0A1I4AV62_9PROT|nr:DUF1028 domain-containing protein [Falsiroseomonas stagni]SFK59579.1 Uncharacterized conserved protein, Ntn-hydrolase superfamily [Falsiroseomonas stagni DSM 19981]
MTWSILARDAATGELGVAVASRFLAVGALCPRVEGGVGAAATQALVNPWIAPRALAALKAGQGAEDALGSLIAADAGRATRQAHVLSADGRSARHTGADCIGWCGHVAAQDVSVAGNMLAGPQVIEATRDAFLGSAGLPLAERLMLAMEAGEAAGGDKRGRQSVALQVASDGPIPDLDLRVDDHADPLAELRRIYRVWHGYTRHFRRFLPSVDQWGADHPGVFDRAVIQAAISAAQAEQE